MIPINKPKNIQWVFFDLDGTLADSIPMLFEVYRNFLREAEIPNDEADLNQLNGFSLSEIIHFLKSKYKINISSEELYSLYKSKISEAYEREVTPMPGASEVLQRIGQLFKIQLVTSGARSEAMGFIRKQGWENLFTSYVFGDEITKGKPNPEIYNLAKARAGCSTQFIVTLEDSVNGVKASTDAGLMTIGFSKEPLSEKLLKAGAFSTIQNLSELLPILE
jgi:HAD superfamily hydrolase (TIGR01509 family)